MARGRRPGARHCGRGPAGRRLSGAAARAFTLSRCLSTPQSTVSTLGDSILSSRDDGLCASAAHCEGLAPASSRQSEPGLQQLSCTIPTGGRPGNKNWPACSRERSQWPVERRGAACDLPSSFVRVAIHSLAQSRSLARGRRGSQGFSPLAPGRRLPGARAREASASRASSPARSHARSWHGVGRAKRPGDKPSVNR